MTKNVNFVSTHLGLPYTGSADPELSESQHTEKVVLALLADKLDSGHSVFMDNYYRVSINDCRVQPAMETCQILNVPLCSANNECHIFRLGCLLLIRDKFQLCFTLANINVFII
jgi:hypothetical protein